ncbi:phosphate starvation-inducible protein PhoH [Roseateles aquatilis]|uniref:PhoH-like protein n=1 Tax=Roseateles aquatilis TaxID=431061 RepID=A0A2D0AM78_9BURK|nr:phosphate starvation-inducible protein PhoH [Roseateles aquatilis]
MNLRHAFTPADNRRLSHLCGTLDEHLRQIATALSVRISRRGEHFHIEGDRAAAQRALTLLEALYARADRPISDETLRIALVEAAADLAKPGAAPDGEGTEPDSVVLRTRRADLAGRTTNQHQYLRHILSHDISFGIGPAGTGKTFLAVACAVDALERSTVQRIILTRPAVEAGERLGFLPGDLTQKVDPYLRPLYDALYDLMGFDRVTKAFEKGQLEIAPLAFMRGRTLNHAFVILDEAQNTTPEQMKMFLTRIGFGSKCVVTGDTSQIDLPRGSVSGLVDAEQVLDGVDGIAVTRFTRADVVRHPLVARIVQAYEEQAAAHASEQQARDALYAQEREERRERALRLQSAIVAESAVEARPVTAVVPTPKPSARQAAKTTGKTTGKTLAKPPAQPAAKAVAKPAMKAGGRSAAKAGPVAKARPAAKVGSAQPKAGVARKGGTR